MPRLLRLAACLLGLFVLIAGTAACGGGGGDDDEDPTPTSAATEEPSSTNPFDSFHYTVDLEFSVVADSEDGLITGTVEGDYVAPDSHAFSTSFSVAGLSGTEEAVIIDDQAWYRESGTEWRETTRDDPDIVSAIELTSADPGFLSADNLGEDLAGLDSEIEERNGVSTRRYHIPRDAVDTLIDIFGDEFLQDASGLRDFEMTVWLEEESGALIRAEFSASASPELFGEEDPFLGLDPNDAIVVSMVIDLTQINDSSISIEPPI
jgi:hypothetical protein